MIYGEVVGEGTKGGRPALNGRLFWKGRSYTFIYDSIVDSNATVNGIRLRNVYESFEDYKLGLLLIPKPLTVNIRLTDCENNRIPNKIIPTNHVPTLPPLFQ